MGSIRSLLSLLPATTFHSSPCSIRSLRWTPCGRINSACTPSFVSVRASAAGTENKLVLKSGGAAGMVTTSNFMASRDKPPAKITRPMVEIFSNLDIPVPDNMISPDKTSISWHYAIKTLNIYAPGWCGEVRGVTYSDNASVTVVYRVTILGTDGQAHREATGTVALNDGRSKDPVAKAEEKAFVKACAKFGLGVHLYLEGKIAIG